MPPIGGMEIWGVLPDEIVWRVEVIGGHWIKRMGDGVQSGFQIVLTIPLDFDALPLWKPAKINKCVDECRVIMTVPGPFDRCTIVPGFPKVTGMGAVLVAIFVCEQREAWEHVMFHFGQAVATQEVHD